MILRDVVIGTFITVIMLVCIDAATQSWFRLTTASVSEQVAIPALYLFTLGLLVGIVNAAQWVPPVSLLVGGLLFIILYGPLAAGLGLWVPDPIGGSVYRSSAFTLPYAVSGVLVASAISRYSRLRSSHKNNDADT
jgi:uncharacterized membrane protein YcfT